MKMLNEQLEFFEGELSEEIVKEKAKDPKFLGQFCQAVKEWSPIVAYIAENAPPVLQREMAKMQERYDAMSKNTDKVTSELAKLHELEAQKAGMVDDLESITKSINATQKECATFEQQILQMREEKEEWEKKLEKVSEQAKAFPEQKERFAAFKQEMLLGRRVLGSMESDNYVVEVLDVDGLEKIAACCTAAENAVNKAEKAVGKFEEAIESARGKISSTNEEFMK